MFPALAAAQGSDTIYDDADELTEPQEQNVQQAFDSAQEESGQSLHAFLVPGTSIDANDEAAQRELLLREAREEDLAQDAGVVLVAPDGEWAQTYNFPQGAYERMVPDFQQGDFAAGLVAGAREISGGPPAAQGDAGGLPGGGLPLLLLVAVVGAFLLFRNRRADRRRVEEERGLAEGEFAELTTRLNEFDEKEKLVSGYLEAQRPLLDQQTEDWVEKKISDAKTAGFAREFNDASSTLTSDPVSARRKMVEGRGLLDGSLRKLDEAEEAINDYRNADDALDGKLGLAKEELRAAEEAERHARAEGVSVEHLDLHAEYDRLARQAADRASRRDEFDPRENLAAVEALIGRARWHTTAMHDEVAAREALPDQRHAAEGEISRARETLGDYERSHQGALEEFGPAALEEVPSPGELSANLLLADGCTNRAARAGAAGRFTEARSLLAEASELAGQVMLVPGRLKAATAAADRKKRAGEEKLNELEARLAQAKANEHLMAPHQRQRLRDYEYQLGNARYGFFGGDWLTALLLFEALDNDYMYMGDPSAGFGDGFDGGSGDDWGGGDF